MVPHRDDRNYRKQAMSFPKRNPASEAARRTIRDAFKDLEKTVAPADACNFENATLQNVRKAALDIENQLGMRASLRNMRRMSPLFDGLGYLAKSIEVLCNGTPFLPWLWAPISLVLTVNPQRMFPRPVLSSAAGHPKTPLTVERRSHPTTSRHST